MQELVFKNAQAAFEYLYSKIGENGEQNGNGTKKLTNVGFKILNPLDNYINTPFRKWNLKYAIREFAWYMSKNRSVEEIKKYAPIWDNMHGGNNIVNSNYGYQWSRNEQLLKAIKQLKENPKSRQAWITIFDGKEKDDYAFDTPCALNLGFTVEENRLNLTVLMRSNDLWYGFCNDQYCFSQLLDAVALELNLQVGWYFHFAADLHLYEQHFNKTGLLKLDL